MQPHQRQLIEYALHIGALKFGEFVMKSKRKSPYFFNAGTFCDGLSYFKLGQCYADTIQKEFIGKYDVLFGPAYKGIALSVTASLGLQLKYDVNMPVAYNRKEEKDHGEGGLLIGAPLAGKRVLLVDDVITAGVTIRDSIQLIQKSGGTLVGAVVIVDRAERGLTSQRSAVQEVAHEFGIKVASVVNLSNIIEYLKITDPDGQADNLKQLLAYQKEYGTAE